MSKVSEQESRSTALGLRAGLGIATLVTLLVAGVAWLLPDTWAATAIAVVFLAATYLLAIRDQSDQRLAAFGLEFGGVLSARPLELRRIAFETARAFVVAALVALVVFPPFVLGFVWWWRPEQAFAPIPAWDIMNELFEQLFAIALPEEVFYRGFLQSTLGFGFARTRRFQRFAPHAAILVSSAIFALGHLATAPQPARLAVFFPALVFGWLRCKTGGIGSAVWFHAFCNTFASMLGQSYGLFR
jgi:uncharacterized protein